MNDNYAYVQGDNNPTGFSNNWLESRKNTHLFDEHYSDFALYDEHRAGSNVYTNVDNTSYRDIVKTMVERSPVSDMFFSHTNMKHIKTVICNTVHKRSGGKYTPDPEAQSDNDLLLIMRSIYLNHAKHLDTNIKGQVADLNYQVILDLVPRVISNAQQHLSYVRDHSQQPLMMDRPQYVASAGTRSNRSVTTTFI
jgi:hypothetical protein